ncbi:hypothetical protein CORC01_02319 [Colletotrichum orchidophilum]|uniref:Uncharacterized protein n=1 Tax=Colletotrichum orchidophilum TaxID=1209926 RepID=A0A1G4BLZ2_9PEZI|nr:uncharacterized protein CORC01_02319 [Colletotrichum orchidophilum]OHF02326.1 hypothetical protein CORC01_02319 [Colletotrichum orchidophilum]
MRRCADIGIDAVGQRRIEVRTPEPPTPDPSTEPHVPTIMQSTTEQTNFLEPGNMEDETVRFVERDCHNDFSSASTDLSASRIGSSSFNVAYCPDATFSLPRSEVINWSCGEVPDDFNNREKLSFFTQEVARLQAKIEPRAIHPQRRQIRSAANRGERNAFLPLPTSAQGILYPIATLAEGILHRWDMSSLLKDNGAKSFLLRMDPGLLHLLFSVTVQLCRNNLARKGLFHSLFTWVRNTNIGGQLKAHLRENPGDADALAKAAAANLRRDHYHTRRPGETTNSQPWSEQLVYLYDNQEVAMSVAVASSLLHPIAATSSVQAAEILVFRGADLNHVDPTTYSGTPLCLAVSQGQTNMVKYLVEAGADINRYFNQHNTEEACNALTIAMIHFHLDIIEFLLSKGASVPAHTDIDTEKLYRELTGYEEFLYPYLRQWLLRHRLLLNKMLEAAESSNEDLCNVLLASDVVPEEALESLLRQAIVLRNDLALRTLLRYGVNPNAPPRHIKGPSSLGLKLKKMMVTPIRLAVDLDAGNTIIYQLLKAGACLEDDTVRKLLRRLSTDNDGMSLFHTLMVQHGHQRPIIGATALEVAAEKGSVITCGYLLERGAHINHHGVHGLSCLQMAASRGKLPLIRFLLDSGADVNLPAHDEGGRTALQAAVEHGHSSVVKCLLDAGAEIRISPAKNGGVTVLEAFARRMEKIPLSFSTQNTRAHQVAKEESDLREFQSWLALGAPINRADRGHGSLLHSLMRTIQHKCFDLALKLGARIEDREEANSGAMTPLQRAADLGCFEEAQLLLEHGANVNAPPGEEYGRTALQAAACCQNSDRFAMVQMLLSFGADIAALPAKKGGLTALQGAATRGDISLANVLLGRGANVNAPGADEDGRTAIEGAAEYGHLHMVQFLLGAGAVGDPAEGFSSAIDLAQMRGWREVAQFLSDHDTLSAFLKSEVRNHTAESVIDFQLPSLGFSLPDDV